MQLEILFQSLQSLPAQGLASSFLTHLTFKSHKKGVTNKPAQVNQAGSSLLLQNFLGRNQTPTVWFASFRWNFQQSRVFTCSPRHGFSLYALKEHLDVAVQDHVPHERKAKPSLYCPSTVTPRDKWKVQKAGELNIGALQCVYLIKLLKK